MRSILLKQLRFHRSSLCFLILFSLLLSSAPVRAAENAQVTWNKELLEGGLLEASVSGAASGQMSILAVYDASCLESCALALSRDGSTIVRTEASDSADRAKVFLWDAETLNPVSPVLGTLTPGVVYRGFAGRYQHIFVNGKKLREADGQIIADASDVSDQSDQFLPRDMGDGSYAFESRSSNQYHMEAYKDYDYDEYGDLEWVTKYQKVYNGYTRRIAAAEPGARIQATKYCFSNLSMVDHPAFEGMNDNTQHWIRERSDTYTRLHPSYYLKSLDNDAYIGLSEDGGSLIAVPEANRATITFEAVSDDSPLYLLSKTTAYAQLSDLQRARIERVYESVAGDAFELHGAVMAENASPRGKLDALYEEIKNLPDWQKTQKLNGYLSLSGAYVTEHRSSAYHITDLPETEGVTARTGEPESRSGYPNWYNWSKTPSKNFLVYPLTVYGADEQPQQTIELWVEDGDVSSSTNAERFTQIISKIPYIYRKEITTVMMENSSVNSYFSSGPHLYMRMNHPNGAASIEETMIHEMGHSLDARRGNGNNWSGIKEDWDVARHADLFSMSSYGAEESKGYCVEDFAEFCRFYFTCYGNQDRQRALMILCPNRYELFRQIREENLDHFSLWEDEIILPWDQ